jgi:hypothetical protein
MMKLKLLLISIKDTINWMLEEAIENDETKIIAN